MCVTSEYAHTHQCDTRSDRGSPSPGNRVCQNPRGISAQSQHMRIKKYLSSMVVIVVTEQYLIIDLEL